MTLYKQGVDGRFSVLEQTRFTDLERHLEDWIEANPEILVDGEPLAVIARQPRNTHGKFLDLLAVDRRGNTVVAELKRGEAPREVIAQALEYAAWVDSLSADELDEIARNYAARKGAVVAGVADLYQRTFAGGNGDEESETDPTVVTFNGAQAILVVAESFAPETEQTARYLRVRQGADMRLVKFSVHRAGGETVLETSTIVGREQPRSSARAGRDAVVSDDAARAHVTTDFMKSAVGAFDRWAEASGIDNLLVEHAGPHRRIRYQGDELIYWYYAKRWIRLWVNHASAAELTRARSELAQPIYVSEQPQGFWCRLYEPRDLELVEELLRRRIESASNDVLT